MFEEGVKPEHPEENLSVQSREYDHLLLLK